MKKTWFFILFFIVIIAVGFFIYHNISIAPQNSNSENKLLLNNASNTTQNTEIIETELFSSYYEKAESIMSNMSLADKVGQLFFVRCPESGQIDMITNSAPGGYLLFGRDFSGKTKAQVINEIKSYQEASQIPLLIGVDEEGGTVVRISSNKNLSATKFKSPQAIYSSGGYDAIREDAITKSKLLLSLGINVNLAPICDVSTDSSDFIYQRSFGQAADKTSGYVKAVVDSMNSTGLSCTLKHFPGYGNNIDTHTDVAHDNRSYETFENSDFLPFEAGIASKAQSILVSHNIVNSMDAEHPASLSPKVHEILRKDLGFTGIIMTDDLAMDAIKKYTQSNNAAILAIQAGNDLIITSDFENQKQAVLKAISNKELDESLINSSVKRVLAWKCYMGILK